MIPSLGTGLPAYTPYLPSMPYSPVVPASYSMGPNYAMNAAMANAAFAQPQAPVNTPTMPAAPTFNIPPTTGITALPTTMPLAPEAQVRLRYVELQLTGLNTDGDRKSLEQTLNKLKEVRGVSIKAKADGSSVAKVWYSEKTPVSVDDLIEATAKLGFVAASN